MYKGVNRSDAKLRVNYALKFSLSRKTGQEVALKVCRLGVTNNRKIPGILNVFSEFMNSVGCSAHGVRKSTFCPWERSPG